MPRSLLRGATLLGAANLAVKPAWIVFLTAVCPRMLGVEGFGVMQTALALAALAVSFTDLGATSYTVREVARAPAQGRRLLREVLLYRGVLTVVAIVGMGTVAWALEYAGVLLESLWVAAAFVLAQTVGGTLGAFLRAYARLDIEAIATVAGRVLVIGLGTLGLWWTRSPVGVLAGMGAGMSLTVVAQGLWVRYRLVEGASGQRGYGAIGVLAVAALPIGAAEALQVVYVRVDQVMVEAILGSLGAGHYAQAFRLLEAMSLLPAIVVQAALLPKFAQLDAQGEEAAFRRLYARSAVGLVLVGGVAAVAVAASALPLIRLLTGGTAFDPSADVLRVLVWTFPLTCMKDLAFIAHLARRRHRLPIAINATAVVANVLLNMWALPRYGILGAAATTVVVEGFVVAGYAAAALRGPRSPSFTRTHENPDSRI